MLTPIDIQSKSFKSGFGYDRKDVDHYISQIVESFEATSQENQQLKKQIDLLNSSLEQYQNIEKSLQKALLLAQKTSEDIRKQAQEKAKIIEDDARHRANLIISDSKNELEHVHGKTLALIHQYELYKAQFEQLARTQVQILRSESFMINDDELNRLKDEAIKTILEGQKQSSQGEHPVDQGEESPQVKVTIQNVDEKN